MEKLGIASEVDENLAEIINFVRLRPSAFP
jgi:hypothetical protein